MKRINPEDVRKILIRGTNWIGDAVMSIPALREIRRIFQRSEIVLLVRPWVRDVYSAVEFVDRVSEYDKQVYQGWRGLRRLAEELEREQYDMAILLQNAFEAAFLAWSARIPIRLGYARDARSVFLTHPCRIDPRLRDFHQAYYYLGVLTCAGLLEGQPPWERPGYQLNIRIGIREEDSKAAVEILQAHGIDRGQPVIGLNPGAYFGGAKRWLTDRYAKVADELALRHGARIVIFGASGERRIAEEIAGQMKSTSVILAGQTTLGQLMGLLKECRLVITNDSGPMHLAAALDVPQLAIFGSTSEIATGPLSRQAEVIKHPVACNPCFLRECPIDFRCMTRITVERVIGAAESKLAQISGAQNRHKN